MRNFNLTVFVIVSIVAALCCPVYGSSLKPSDIQVLAFDDVTAGAYALNIGIGGFEWRGLGVINARVATNYSGSTTSGDYVAFNWDKLGTSMGGEWFYADSFYASAISASELMLVVSGFGDKHESIFHESFLIQESTRIDIAELVYDLEFRLQLVGESIRGASLTSSYVRGNFAIDDFRYSRNLTVEAAPAPEPETMLLLGIGLLGISGVTRKKLLTKKVK